MKPLYAIYGVILVFTTYLQPIFAFGYGKPPGSVAEAKRRQTFIRLVPAEPDNFDWEGHEVAIDECWLDRYLGKPAILFKLKIDGKHRRERTIESQDGKFLEFERVDQKKPPPLAYNLSRGLVGQQRIHYVYVPKPEPDTLTLSVNTGTIVDFKPIKKSAGVQILFRITEKSQSQEPPVKPKAR